MSEISLDPNISSLLEKDFITYKGEKKVSDVLYKKRSLSRGNFYAVWCVDYEQSLDDYFKAEIELADKFTRFRLINIEALTKNAKNKDRILSHLSDNKKWLTEGKYEVYSTSFNSFEFVICDGAEEEEKAVAILLFRNLS